jgi:hypothetical protein
MNGKFGKLDLQVRQYTLEEEQTSSFHPVTPILYNNY